MLVSAHEMEWDRLCSCRISYRFILLAEYYELPETSWASRSISLSLFTLRILRMLRSLVSVAVPLLKDTVHVLLIKITGKQASVDRSKVQSTFRGQLTSFMLYFRQLKGTAFEKRLAHAFRCSHLLHVLLLDKG